MVGHTTVKLKKYWNRKSNLVQMVQSMQVSWFSDIIFHLRPFWLQTLVAINSKLWQKWVPNFCSLSEVVVLFHRKLSRRPFLGQYVDFDLLLCTGFNKDSEVLFLFLSLTQRPMNYCKIEWSNEHCLVNTKFSRNQLNNFEFVFVHWKRNSRHGQEVEPLAIEPFQ